MVEPTARGPLRLERLPWARYDGGKVTETSLRTLQRLSNQSKTCLRQRNLPATEVGRRSRRLLNEQTMSAETASGPQRPAREVALEMLAVSAASNIPGVDFVSITVPRRPVAGTVASTNPVAEKADSLQYELHEGPCYAAVTDERFMLINDLAASVEFPRYGPRAVALGVGAQAGIQLLDGGRERAGLNLYAYASGAFDRYTAQFAELFATQSRGLARVRRTGRAAERGASHPDGHRHRGRHPDGALRDRSPQGVRLPDPELPEPQH